MTLFWVVLGGAALLVWGWLIGKWDADAAKRGWRYTRRYDRKERPYDRW